MDEQFKKLLSGGKWAENATDNIDPDDSSVSPTLTRTDGFPSAYSQQVGGVKPDRRRINQLLRELSGAAFEVRMGVSPYDADVDYPVDAITQITGTLYRAKIANGPNSGTGGASNAISPTADTNATTWERVTGSVTDPEKPRDILFDNSVPNEMDIRWRNGRDGGSRISRYDFQWRLHNPITPNPWTPPSPMNLGYAQHTLTSLRSGDQVQVRVRAWTIAGDDSDWTVSTVSDDQDSNDRVRGGVPSGGDLFGLTATQSGNNAFLDWAAVANGGFAITRYIVQWREENGQFSASNQTTTTGSITQATIPNLTRNPATKYFFRVRAENSQGQGPWSNIAELTMRQLTTRVQPSLSAPTISNISSGSFTASANWSNNTDQPTATPTSANWYWRDAVGGSWTPATYSGLTGFTLTGLTANRQYEVRYRLNTSVGQTGDSPAASVTTQSVASAVPGAPSSISVSVGVRSGLGGSSGQTVFVNWGNAQENGQPIVGWNIRWVWSGRSLNQSASRNGRSSSTRIEAPAGTQVTVYVNARNNGASGPARSATISLT